MTDVGAIMGPSTKVMAIEGGPDLAAVDDRSRSTVTVEDYRPSAGERGDLIY